MRTKSLKKKVRSKPRMCQASPPAVPVVTTLQKTIYLWASDGPPLKHHQPMCPQNRMHPFPPGGRENISWVVGAKTVPKCSGGTAAVMPAGFVHWWALIIGLRERG